MRRALLTILLALTAAAPAAAAGPETGIADDRVLFGDAQAADTAVARWAELGVEVVRIHASWDDVAPSIADPQAPAGFEPAEHTDPGYRWDALDAAVARVRAAGMKVVLALVGPAPLWASLDPVRGNPRWRPSPAAYAAWSRAAATRYGGDVDEYVLWNEPNQPFWLQPQSSCTRGRCRTASPHHYRNMVRAARPAIRAADPGAKVLIGALAPRGRSARATNTALRPLAFLRALGCVDPRLRSVRAGGCRGFRPATADGFSLHPHGIRNAPDDPFAHPDDAHIASLPRVERLLDRLAARRRLIPSTTRWRLWLTEHGYQTNPPDDVLGVAPATQARWLQQTAYLAWRDPRVANLTQYEWRDEPLRATAGTTTSAWQSGLLFADGREKPALDAFPVPVWPDRRRSLIWGQVRPGDGHEVLVQGRRAGERTWRTIGRAQTDARGFWVRRGPVARGASYRVQVPAAGLTGVAVTAS